MTRAELAGGEDAAVFPAGLEGGQGGGGVGGGDDDFEESFAGDDGVGGFFVDFAVEGDDAAEGGGGVAGVGEVESSFERFGLGATAGVGVLDDGGGGELEFADEVDGGVGVEEVDVGEGFAVELFCGGDARFGGSGGIEGGELVGVFAVTEVLDFRQMRCERREEAVAR